MIAIDTRDAVSNAGLMRRAAVASLAVSLFLVAIKAFAYFTSYSVSVLASLADSALDLFTSALNLVAIRSALTPADAEHRFGHGKAEPLAGLAQGAFIASSAMFLIVQAGLRLFNPEPVEEEAMATHITTSAAMLCSMGSGTRMRLTAWITRNSAEAVMKAPWARPASGSALPWPKRCSASAGVSA